VRSPDRHGIVLYDLFIFDLDGTLIDSVGDIADSLNETLASYGLPPYDDARVAGFIGAGVRELVRRALPATEGEKRSEANAARGSAEPVARPPKAAEPAPLEAEIAERRKQEAALRAELDGVRNQLVDVVAQLQVTQTELKLAKSTAKERVDAEWATQTTEQDLAAAREAAKKAEKSAEAARAEAAVLRGEIDRLRAQLHGKDNRPPTLQGVGEPTPTKVPEPEEAAPQKAMPQDDTTKNSGDDRPGFWGRLFKGKKEESD